MTDLTPIFNQCVEIVEASIKPQDGQRPPKQTKKPEYTTSDTFYAECKDLYTHVVGLNLFIGEVKRDYLSVNYDDPYHKPVFTMDDKNKLDEDFHIKVQALYEKLKLLQSYEKQRESKLTKKTHWIGSIFGDEEEDTKELYYLSVSSHRTQILRFLNDAISATNKSFEELQRKRLQREKQLDLLNFQNIEEDLDLDVNFDVALQDDNVTTFESDQLTQEQLQEYESENKQFLEAKTNQLKQVEKLHTSMMDIVNMQSEITSQIENQSNQIMNLIDNQDQINVDLRMGNKNLTSATNKNKRGSNLIIMTCIILGVLLLFLDYISF